MLDRVTDTAHGIGNKKTQIISYCRALRLRAAASTRTGPARYCVAAVDANLGSRNGAQARGMEDRGTGMNPHGRVSSYRDVLETANPRCQDEGFRWRCQVFGCLDV